jgi:hypothetical protein
VYPLLLPLAFEALLLSVGVVRSIAQILVEDPEEFAQSA